MTISMCRVIEILKSDDFKNIDLRTLGFILTVLRDNCLNEETSKVLNDFVNVLWSVTNGKVQS